MKQEKRLKDFNDIKRIEREVINMKFIKFITRVTVWLQGKKSYFIALFTAIYTLIKAFGWIVTTPEQDVAVYALFASLFGVALKAGLQRKE